MKSHPERQPSPLKKINPVLLGRVLFGVALLGLQGPGQADIVLDGSMGPAGPLAGPKFDIPASLGQKVGRNLFHSFADFQLNSGESATFSGPGDVRNILSRVTGGTPSLINGQLNSTIAGANFFFLNPAGTVFGPTAEINVGGSFVVTSAHELKLADGGKFSAIDPFATQLTSAPPQAFGFLTPNPQPIVFINSQIGGAPGGSLSVVGGDIQMRGSLLAADGGINIVSVGSSGEVKLNVDNPTKPIELNNFSQLGSLELSQGSELRGVGAGGVTARAQNMVVDNSQITFLSGGPLTSKGADLQVRGDLSFLQGGGIQALNDLAMGPTVKLQADRIILGEGAQIVTLTLGPAKGGDVTLSARQLQLLDGAQVNTATQGTGSGGSLTVNVDDLDMKGKAGVTGLFAVTQGSGNGGPISIRAKNIRLHRGAISASSQAGGDNDVLTIIADSIIIDGGESNLSGIGSDSRSTGSGGLVDITAKDLQVIGGGTISASSLGNGAGGSIVLKADNLKVQGKGERSSIVASAFGSGTGGTVQINAKNLTMLGKGLITTTSYGTGNTGDLTVNADKISVDAQNLEAAGLSSESYDAQSGRAGNLHITAKELELRRGGTISTSTASQNQGGDIFLNAGKIHIQGETVLTGITATTAASGQGGNLNIHADQVTVESQGSPSGILANTVGNGNGGQINLQTKGLKLEGQGSISTAAFGSGNSGDINLIAEDILLDGTRNQGDEIVGISAGSRNMATGNGGDIRIKTKSLQLKGKVGIDASTETAGNGGNIFINAKDISLDSQNRLANGISALSGKKSDPTYKTGQSGNITINTDSLQLKGNSILNTETNGSGQGGNISVQARDLLIDGTGKDAGFTHISSETSGSSGNSAGGKISLKADRFTMRHDALVSSSTGGAGNGGTVEIEARDATLESGSFVGALTAGAGQGGGVTLNVQNNLTLDGKGQVSGLTAQTFYTGAKPVGDEGTGGTISVQAKNIILRDGAAISSSSEQFPGTSELPTGNSGKIRIDGEEMLVERSTIASQSIGTGVGGSVTLNIKGGLTLRNAGISALSTKSDGGSLEFNVGRSFYAKDSLVTAIAFNNGGNVFIRPLATSPLRYIVLDQSVVQANAIHGNGGNIILRSNIFLPTAQSIVDASSQFGITGNVDIDSPNTNVGGSLVTLPSNLLSAENYLNERCEVRTTGASSSFTINPQNGVPVQPGQLLPSPATK